jgi:hypothetical protein
MTLIMSDFRSIITQTLSIPKPVKLHHKFLSCERRFYIPYQVFSILQLLLLIAASITIRDASKHSTGTMT